MKKLLVTLVAVASVVTAFSQGTITFNNGVPNVVVAPIFGPQAGDSIASLSGNAAATSGAPAGFPAGTTVYTGTPLSGNGYFAQLFGAAGAGRPTDTLQALGTAAGTNAVLAFRTASGQLGLVRTITPAVVCPGSAAGDVWTIQVRVWENRGNLLTWADAMALNDASLLRGESSPINLTLGPSPVNLLGLTSFNIHAVPEPSVIALGVLGVGALLLFRRRKN